MGGHHSPVDVATDVACSVGTVPPALQYLFTSGMEWSQN